MSPRVKKHQPFIQFACFTYKNFHNFVKISLLLAWKWICKLNGIALTFYFRSSHKKANKLNFSRNLASGFSYFHFNRHWSFQVRGKWKKNIFKIFVEKSALQMNIMLEVFNIIFYCERRTWMDKWENKFPVKK